MGQANARRAITKQDVNIDLIVCKTESGGVAVKALLVKCRTTGHTPETPC